MDGRRDDLRYGSIGTVVWRFVTAGAVSATIIGCAPLAQLPDPAELRALDDDRTDVTYEDMTIDDIEGMDVVRNGEVVGDVEGVLADDDDEIVALAVDFEGGVFDGDSEVVVPIEQLEFDPATGRVVLTLADVDLARLPTWED